MSGLWLLPVILFPGHYTVSSLLYNLLPPLCAASDPKQQGQAPTDTSFGPHMPIILGILSVEERRLTGCKAWRRSPAVIPPVPVQLCECTPAPHSSTLKSLNPTHPLLSPSSSSWWTAGQKDKCHVRPVSLGRCEKCLLTLTGSW